MKKAMTFCLACAAVLVFADDFRDIEARVMPVPQKIEVVSDDGTPLKEGTKFRIATPLNADEVVALVTADVKLYWRFTPRVVCEKGGEKVADEGYLLDTTKPEIVVTASSLAGVRNALRSMRQLAEPERGVARAKSFVIPQVKMDDFPQLKFRGLHYCDKREPWRIERAIRLAAYCKYNYFVLECSMKLKKHPEYKRKTPLSQEDVRRLVKLGKELGITLIPCISIFGHQSSIDNGGQILLDQDPGYASLFEPSGSSWCISNPAAVQYLEDIVTEYLDVYGNPPYFHATCDEAYNAGSCLLCRKGGNFWKKAADHINHFRDFCAARNCRMMIWHDMLVLKDDPAWKGSTSNGDKDAEKLRQALKRDIIICYWEYRFANHEYRAPKDGVMGFPLFDLFRKEGFDVVNSGWEYDTTMALGEKAFKGGGLGILQTTWGSFSNSGNYHTMLAMGSTSGWNPLARYPQVIDGHIFTVDLLNRYVRDVNYDMGITDPAKTGTK